jgi:hypothetical protein
MTSEQSTIVAVARKHGIEGDFAEARSVISGES